jgi:hypothetical protein
MDSDASQQLRREPPDRRNVGFLTLLLLTVRAFLARFFAAKHPGNFDLEFGSWTFPDFNLVPGATRPPPQPLVNKDCEKTYLIYNYVTIQVPRCTLPSQVAAAGQALNEVQAYFTNQFRCDDPNCKQKRADIVWVGLVCAQGPRDGGGVLVRFRCDPAIVA